MLIAELTRRRLRPGSIHFLTTLSTFFLLTVTLFPRLEGFDRGLWTAEAWVANSVTSESLAQVFYYDGWLQTTPPLFLLLVRSMVWLFHLSNRSLRLVPLFLGIAGVLLVAWFSMRAFRPPLALFCTSLVAFSPLAIAYSKELKQYTADAAASALLLLLLWRYRERADQSSYLHILFGFGTAFLLSYSAIMFVPLACLVVIATEPAGTAGSRRWRPGVIRCLGLVALAAVEGSAIYLAFIRPNLAPNLHDFWRENFPSGGGIPAAVVFYARFFPKLALYFFAPTNLQDVVVNLRSPLHLLHALAALAAAAVVWLLVRFRRDCHRLWLAAFAVLPILTLAALNHLHLYPVSPRLVLFLLPSVAIGLTLTLDCILDALRLRSARLQYPWWLRSLRLSPWPAGRMLGSTSPPRLSRRRCSTSGRQRARMTFCMSMPPSWSR